MAADITILHLQLHTSLAVKYLDDSRQDNSKLNHSGPEYNLKDNYHLEFAVLHSDRTEEAVSASGLG